MTGGPSHAPASAPGAAAAPAAGRLRPGLALAMAAALVLLAGAGAWAWTAAREPVAEAPGFTLVSTGFEGGALGEPVEFSLEDYRGRVVLIDFMAVACESCRIVTKEVLHPIDASFGDEVVLVSIDAWAGSLGEDDEGVIDLQRRENATWRHALDTAGVARAYGVAGLPHLAVVGPDGALVFADAGLPERSDVEAAIQRALSGDDGGERVLRVGLVGFAFVAGATTVFTPCSVGLLPGYMALLLRRGGPTPGGAVRRTLAAGLVTAAGVVFLYAALAFVLWSAGDALRPLLPRLLPVVGVSLLALGLLLLGGFDWGFLTRRLRIDGRRGFFAFGAAYALAGFGCTGPVFLPILVAGFVKGTAVGAVVFLAYAAAVALFVFLAAYLVATSHLTLLRRILARSQVVAYASAALMAAAGLYLLWFAYRANGAGLGLLGG